MSTFPKFFFTLFKSGLRPIWERVSNLYLDFLNDNYIVSGTPSTLSSYVTHSRSGNATMTDSDGLIKWAPHNLVTYSEDFSQWSETRVTATADYIAMDSTDANTHYVSTLLPTQTIGASYVFEVEIKPDSVTLAYLYTRNESSSATTTWINLSTATVGTDTSSGASATELPDGWILCSIPFNIPTGDTTASIVNIFLAETDGVAAIATAVEGAGFFARNARYYRSDLGGMVDNPDRGDSYVPTTSTAVYLPRRGHHTYNGGQWVNEGLLTESESRQNLVEESEDFSGYTLTNLASIAVSASPLAPDGNQTALRLLDNSSTSLKALSNNTYTVLVVSGDRVTISAYFQKGTLSYGVIYAVVGIGTPFGAGIGTLPVDRAACFDLENGNVGEVGSLLSDGRVENVGNGWYRCSVTVIAGGTGTLFPAFGLTDADDGDVTYTSAGTGTVYLWGAQMEVGATPSSYMPTSGATFTRAADTLTIPAANLPWPTATYAAEFEASSWSGANWDTFTTDGTTFSADKSTAGGTDIAYSDLVVACLLGEEVYIEVDFLSGTNTQAKIGLSDGTNIRSTTVIVNPSAGGTFGVYVNPNIASGTFSIYVATTLLGTINVTAARAKTVRRSLSIQMDGRMTYADTNSNPEARLFHWVSGANYIRFDLRTDSTRTGGMSFYQSPPATQVASSDLYYSPDILVPFNIAGRHGSTFLNGALSGTALTANTTPTALPDLSSTDLDLAQNYMGTIRTFRIWDADLTDEGIAYVSERSEEPTISLSFNSSESSFTVSDWLP